MRDIVLRVTNNNVVTDLDINAEIPLLAERIKFFPSSIDLNIECEKCWYGPTELPNQPSSDIFSIKLKSSIVLLIFPE